MNENQQLVKTEELPIDVIKNQYPAITDEILKTVHQVAKVDPKWPTTVLLITGAGLLFVSLLVRVSGGMREVVNLTTTEFITLIITAAALMLSSPLFNMYLSRNWRKIIFEQQALGVQILHKEIDIARETLNRRNRRQGGAVIIFHSKIRRFSRR
jgi:hypothetical protein